MTYSPCTLCPRRCGADRAAGQLGYCRLPGKLRVAKIMRHFWEEPALAGPGGSGAIFFSGCTLGCLYCQNQATSHRRQGRQMDSAGLRSAMEALIAQGAENIDLVTPTQFLPDILPALTPKLPVPVVYNCGGYERVETLQALQGLVDIYLPDLKYAGGALAARLSGAPGGDDPAPDPAGAGGKRPAGIGLDRGNLPPGHGAIVPAPAVYPHAPGDEHAPHEPHRQR